MYDSGDLASRPTAFAAQKSPLALVSVMTDFLSSLPPCVTKISLTPSVNPSVCRKLVKTLESADNSLPEKSPPYNSKNAWVREYCVAPNWFLSKTPAKNSPLRKTTSDSDSDASRELGGFPLSHGRGLIFSHSFDFTFAEDFIVGGFFPSGTRFIIMVDIICFPDQSCCGLMIEGGRVLIFPGKSTNAEKTCCWYCALEKNLPLIVIFTPAIT